MNRNRMATLEKQIAEANTILNGIRQLMNGYKLDKDLVAKRIEAYFQKYDLDADELED